MRHVAFGPKPGRPSALAKEAGPVSLPWAIAVRTRVYDELILEAIRRDRPTAVVNIAAGMDARPYRLDLPRSLRWIEIDLPQIVAEKEASLAREAASCEVERVSLDLAERGALGAVLDRVVGEHSSVVAVTEGLLAYLDEPTVDDLARDLFARPAVRSWVLESALPEVLARNRRAWGKSFEKAGTVMRFAPASGVEYFRERGWTLRTKRSCLHEARRLHREPPLAGLLHFIKALTPRGRQWLEDVVVYAVVERREASSNATETTSYASGE